MAFLFWKDKGTLLFGICEAQRMCCDRMRKDARIAPAGKPKEQKGI